MKYVIAILFALVLNIATVSAQAARHVVLISIDGFRPEMYLDSGWPAPNLHFLMNKGTYALSLKSVFPAYTYPSHVAMITGALPARSGICFNQPKGSKGEWNWYNNAIKVPTLWQVLKKAGMITASVEWPPSVTDEITYDLPEIWAIDKPEDRISEARKYATPGLVEEIEKYATGNLDSNSMSEQYLSLDEQASRAAAYIFKAHRPAFMAVHFACVDGMQHEFGRDGDSVRLALAANDHAVGNIIEAIQRSGLKDSTAVIIVGDHGFCTFNTVFRPNLLIRDLGARFIAAGGSAFLYSTGNQPLSISEKQVLLGRVKRSLDSLPMIERKLFRIVEREELDKMGADSAALCALSAQPGLVFSSAVAPAAIVNAGPGMGIQQNPNLNLFFPAKGGHHGYDPDLPQMHTGFIAFGAGIKEGGVIEQLCVTDIAPLIAMLMGVGFKTPDGHLQAGILSAD